MQKKYWKSPFQTTKYFHTHGPTGWDGILMTSHSPQMTPPRVTHMQDTMRVARLVLLVQTWPIEPWFIYLTHNLLAWNTLKTVTTPHLTHFAALVLATAQGLPSGSKGRGHPHHVNPTPTWSWAGEKALFLLLTYAELDGCIAAKWNPNRVSTYKICVIVLSGCDTEQPIPTPNPHFTL